MPLPKDLEDVLLLDELMNGPKQQEEKQTATDFSTQWSQLFGSSKNVTNESSEIVDDEFSQFISARSEDIIGVDEKRQDSFLPSQLFDKDQSLHSDGAKAGN